MSEIYIFISALWGAEVAPARIILISRQIGSSELEQPVGSWFQPLKYVVIDCSFPFREVFFWCKWKWRNSDQVVVPEPSGGGKPRISAQRYHTAWFFYEEEIDEGKKYILILTEYCALKSWRGITIFTVRFLWYNENCFLAKHNRFEACLIVVSCFHLGLF